MMLHGNGWEPVKERWIRRLTWWAFFGKNNRLHTFFYESPICIQIGLFICILNKEESDIIHVGVKHRLFFPLF